jgi:hypothetical protein
MLALQLHIIYQINEQTKDHPGDTPGYPEPIRATQT